MVPVRKSLSASRRGSANSPTAILGPGRIFGLVARRLKREDAYSDLCERINAVVTDADIAHART